MYTIHNIHKRRHRKTIATNCQQRRTHTHSMLTAYSYAYKIQTCNDLNVSMGLLLLYTQDDSLLFTALLCTLTSLAGGIYIGRVTLYTNVSYICAHASACECVCVL